MIVKKISLGSLWWLLLVHSCVHAIYDPNDGAKGRGFHRRPEVSESIVMHHKYSQVASNRPVSQDQVQSYDASSRQGRAGYTNEAENYVAQHGMQCPPQATGQFPYLLNCRQFLNCWKGRGHIQSCAPGTVFNPDTRECDNPAKVICLNHRGETNANNKLARLQQEPTPNDDETPSVVSSEGSKDPSDTESVKCPPDAVGVQPHPLDCSKFLNCANGITYIQACGPGTVFNSVSLVCDFPYNVDCSDRNSSNGDAAQRGQTRQHQRNPSNQHAGPVWNSAGAEGTAALSPGYGDSVVSQSNSYSNYQTQSAHQPHSSSGNNRRVGHSRYGDDAAGPVPSQPTNYHQMPARYPNGYTSTSQRDWHQSGGSPYNKQHEASRNGWHPSGASQGNRDPKLDWNHPESHSLMPAVTNPSSFDVNRAQVYEMPASNAAGTNKMTVHYAQPVDNDDDDYSTEPQQKVPSNFLEPPMLPSHGMDAPHITIGNKTTVYYAQPVGTFNTTRFQGANGRLPVWKPATQPLPSNSNKTVVYYATPAEQYHKSGNNDQQQVDGFPEQAEAQPPPPPLGFLVPPNHQQNSAWSTSGIRTPSAVNQQNPVAPTNSQPFFDSSNRRGITTPTGVSTQTAETFNHWMSAPSEPIPPTAPLVPTPYDALLPPMVDTRTTNVPTRSSVLYPPLDPTSPIVVNHHTRQERVFVVHPQHPSSVSPSINIATSVLYSPSYAGVSHKKSSDEELDLASVEEQTESKKIVPIYSRPNSPLHSKTMMAQTPIHSPPPYNRDYYNPPEARTAAASVSHSGEATDDVPLSQALKMLLRPYFNRSGTVTDDVVSQMDAHIMKLSRTHGPSTQPPKQLPKKSRTASEAALTFPGEEANMNQGTQAHVDDASQENSNENTTKEITYNAGWHHHHNHSHKHHQNHDHRPQSNNRNRSSSAYHSENFHRNHPEIPNPFDTKSVGDQDSAHHSRTFHRNHPEIPNPFATNSLGDQDSIDVRLDANPTKNRKNFAEEFFPPLDADKPAACQFSCGNGKCVREYQVCDGVNDCGNRFDESKCDHIGYEVRLSGEEGKANMGRVEVKVRGEWGYVCDDKFGMRAADILCRELGFALGASEVRGNSYYPPHKEMYDKAGVRYLMDEVDCLGNETSIRECDFKGWGVHDCSPEEVVGVVCKIPVMTCPANYWLCKTSPECVAIGFLCDNVSDCQDGSDESDEICNQTIQYRLKGGNSSLEGRVEVKYRDTWGTICDDDFGKKEAQVICRGLGYLGEATVIKNAYGAGSGPIWLDQVSCLGNETKLEECSHWAWGEHNCDHQEDVSVKCSARPINPRAESTTSTTEPSLVEQFPEEDIDLFLYKVQRSSKAINRNKRCGQINKHAIDEFNTNDELARVVNGTKAIRGHHPWQASIRAKGRNGISSHWCGAILITQMHVLTAAHCLMGYQKEGLFVRMGDHYSQISEPSEIDSFIRNWYVHENFRQGHHMNNDIGLIVLKSPVTLNDYIQPICLPPKDAPYDEGMKCTISGWGSIKSGISTTSNNLKAAYVPIISQAMCKEPYVYGNAITDGMFCAGFLDEGVDACDGDSGGPLACSSQNGETLYGIISWGQHCGQANKPGVYVKIAHYLDWIMEKIMFSINVNARN